MSDGMIHTGPLAGFTVTSDPNDPMIQVLGVHVAGRLGYLAASDEWTCGAEPLPEPPDPDLDTLTRAELWELDGPAGTVANVLDEWLMRLHGVTSSGHGVGLFLDLLAADGWRVTPIDPGPPIESLLPRVED